MQNYIQGDQIKIYFQDGSSILASVQNDDGNNIEATAISKNEAYREGDTVFADKATAKIEKQNFYRKIKKSMVEDTSNYQNILDFIDNCKSYGWNRDKIEEEVNNYYNLYGYNDEMKSQIFEEIGYSPEEAFQIVQELKDQEIKGKRVKKAKRFNWEFDKHAPQWKLNEKKEIEKDEECVTKVARLKKRIDNAMGVK